jgi:uncharacterized protein YndB with AHSA1/START domain
MNTPDGGAMWGKWRIREVAKPERLVFINSFSDAEGGTTRHPLSADWPLEILSAITFEERNGGTEVAIRWIPENATETEIRTFNGGHESMRMGWGGSLDRLEAYLDETKGDAPANEIVSSRILDFPHERVFAAWTDPAQLARWWGPAGFTNTFHVFEPKAGGAWGFVMHGPDGTDYKNESIFVEVAQPERIVFDHLTAPHFRVVATFGEIDGKTRLVFRMIFGSAELCARLRPVCVPGNEQNFDRLEAVLHGK